MSEAQQDYRRHARVQLTRMLDAMARFSFGEFGHRIDPATVPDDEFGEVLCGLDVLMSDVMEARVELDQQNAYNLLRSDIWQRAALASYHSVGDFIQTFLDFLGPRLSIRRVSYYVLDAHTDALVLSYQWARSDEPKALGLRLPGELWRELLTAPIVAMRVDALKGPWGAQVRALMQARDVGATLTAPCWLNEQLIGAVMFSEAAADRIWTERERGLLIELASIVATKAAQIRAEEALRQANTRLEGEVKRRTAEITSAYRELQLDIEKRVLAEAALREREELYRGLVETSPDAILVCDPDGTILMVNESARELFGAARAAELIGRAWLEFVEPQDRERAREGRERLAASAAGRANEYCFLRLDGGRFLGEDRSTRIGGVQGRSRKLLSMVRDITEKRRQEDELFRARKLESVGTLAGGIAHDFNNILTGIMTNIALAKRRLGADDEAERLLADAEAAATRAGGLTKQLLTFSRGGAPVKERASLKELVENAARFCLSGSNASSHLEFAEDLPSVEIDKGQIDQVLNNLFLNAVQAMPAGGVVTARVQTTRIGEGGGSSLAPGEYVCVIIADQGVGIPPENLTKVFDPYFTTRAGGTGLGLTTAYSIVGKHNGLLRCESTPGKGSAFSFLLPVSPLQSQIQATPPQAAPAPSARGGGRILVMDDDSIVRTVMQKLLASAGYEIVLTGGGAEALAAYAEAQRGGRPFAAVVMDLTIQGGTGGKDAVAQLLRLDPQARAIVVSGYSSDPVLADYRSYGFKGMLAKPFKAEDLARVVGDVVNGNGGA